MRSSALRFCLFGLLGLLVVGLGSFPVTLTGQTDSSSSPVAPLKDQLEKGLRARRAVEFQFVARVAQLVDEGQLSKEFVQGSFSWTLKKYRQKKALVPYFEQTLRQRATKEGLTALNNVPTTLPEL